ncbi:EipB family protein [Agaricicola taiwanensis]|nr:DUF1849 family protein [Agaricicola taiwanensis]
MRSHLLLVPLALAATLPAFAAEPRLASHRAVYELTLSNAREAGGVREVSGRIAMEAREKNCRDFELTYRQVMRMAPNEGTPNVIDFRSTTQESTDGKTFSFDNKTFVNGEPDSTVTGKGEKTAQHASISLTSPGEREVTLGDATVFPTQHMKLVLDAAHQGRSTISVPVYDGTDPGDVVTDTVAFIGEFREPDPRNEELLAKENLGDQKVWPVSIGYFEKTEVREDQRPKFVYTAELMDNGITPSVTLDYGTFVVEGRLVELELFPLSDCR